MMRAALALCLAASACAQLEEVDVSQAHGAFGLMRRSHVDGRRLLAKETKTPTATFTPTTTATPSYVPTYSTYEPTTVPVPVPTPGPSSPPTPAPQTPSSEPTPLPTANPSLPPSPEPTKVPTPSPTKTRYPSGVPTSEPSSVPTTLPTSTPTGSPSEVPTTPPSPLPSVEPTPWPSPAPTGTPAPSGLAVSWTAIGTEDYDARGNPTYGIFTYLNNTIEFFFTSYAATYGTNDYPETLVTSDGEEVPFYFLVDVTLQEKDSGTLRDLVLQNYQMSTPFYETHTYVPGQSFGQTDVGAWADLMGDYNLVLFEYNIGIESTSPDLFLTTTHYPSPVPTVQPSAAPVPLPTMSPTSVPTAVPTAETLYCQVLSNDAAFPNRTLGFGDNSVLIEGATVTMFLSFTGSSTTAGSVTVRLCEGFGDSADPCGTLVSTLSVGQHVDAADEGPTQFDIFIPSASTIGHSMDGTDYRFVLYVLYDDDVNSEDRRLSEQSSFYTEEFGISEFYPTSMPTPVPTSGPTFYPSLAPTTVPHPRPTRVPTLLPTPSPSHKPTHYPTTLRAPFRFRSLAMNAAQKTKWDESVAADSQIVDAGKALEQGLPSDMDVMSTHMFIEGNPQLVDITVTEVNGYDTVYGCKMEHGAEYFDECVNLYKDIAYDFEYDIYVYDVANDVDVYKICTGCASKDPLLFRGVWYPSADDFDVNSLYTYRVVEYTYGLAGVSNPYWFSATAAPSSRPSPVATYAPSASPTTYTPTAAPTGETLTLEVDVVDGAETHTLGFGGDLSTNFMKPGDDLTLTMRFTGTKDRSNSVTLRLCEGVPEPGANMCNDNNGFVEEIAFMYDVDHYVGTGEDVCEGHGYSSSQCTMSCCTWTGTSCKSAVGDDECGNPGTAVAFTLPRGTAPADDYYFAMFVYLGTANSVRKLADKDGRRKALDVDDTDDDELEIYFTENFSVVDYEPTPAPFKSKAPSPLPTDKPSKTGDLPTAYPTYVPTAAPINPTVEPTDCEMTFRDLDLEWEWGETVDIDLHMCNKVYSYSYGVIDVLLYEGSVSGDPVETIAQYEAMHTADTMLHFKVPSALPVSDYRIRVIEYGQGFDVESPEILIVGGGAPSPAPVNPSPEPTLEPTPEVLGCFGITVEDLVLDSISNDGKGHGSVAPGSDITFEVEYSGDWPYDDTEVNVAVRLCRGACTSIRQTLIYNLEVEETGGSDDEDATLSPYLETGDDYRFLIEVEEGGETCKSGFFTITNYAPTTSPTPEPTPGPSVPPSPVPTAPTVTFHPQPELWLVGETYDVTIRVGDSRLVYSYGYGQNGAVVDVLLYSVAPSGSSYVDPTETIAVYQELTGPRETFTFAVPSDIAVGSTYQIRVIEYTRGYDVYSDAFTIAYAEPTPGPTAGSVSPTPAPTPAPTPLPTPSTILINVDGLSYDKGQALLAGVAYDLTTQFTGTLTDDLSSVRICPVWEIEDHGHCEPDSDHAQTVAYMVDDGVSASFTPDAKLVEEGLVVFQVMSVQGDLAFTGTFAVADHEPSPAPSAKPSPKPTMSDPSAAPTLTPTARGLHVAVSSRSWIYQETETITVEYTGAPLLDDDLTCYADIIIIDADTEAYVKTVVTGAEMVDCKISLTVTVPADVYGKVKFRATEYTHGYVADSEPVYVSYTTPPSPAPSAAPVPLPSAPPSASPHWSPTVAPTASTLSVAYVSDSDDWIAQNGTVAFTFTYTGDLQKLSGRVTLRLCEGSAAPYNGPADAYDACDEVDQILWSYPIDESLAYDYVLPTTVPVGDAYYFRVDSGVDRTEDGDYSAYSAYTLGYVGPTFAVVGGAPTPRPTDAPTIPPTYPPTTTPVFEPTASPTTASPSAAPVPAPTVGVLLDSALWYKTDEPSKDCVWVSAYFDADNDDYVRCDVKGWDGTFAYESCALTCADYDSSNL